MGTRAGVKSTERVKQHGEVFTPNSIVNDMLDMLQANMREGTDTISYIKKTYLEPACGDGQFLIAILERKLNEVNKLPLELRQYGFVLSFCTIYGVDIQADNVAESIERMYRIANGEAVETFDLNNKTNIIQFTPIDFEITDDMLKSVKYVLNNNILCGDTLQTTGDNNLLMFEYSFDDNNMTISIKTDRLHEDDQLSLFGTTSEVVGTSVPFDKLYTLRTLESIKCSGQMASEPDEGDFDF